MVQYCTSCECVATLVVQLNVFHNPLAKLCSFLKVNTYLNCSFCVLICTFLSTICWVYSPPGSHPCHVTLSATSIPKWLTLRCVWTGMVNFNALAEKINKEFPSVSDMVINSAAGLCSSRAWWPLVPNFCPWATRKPQIFHTNHMLGTLDFTVQSTGLLSIFLRAQPWYWSWNKEEAQ